MKLLFSTKSVHPRDRLAFWVEEATKNFVAHEFSTPVGRNYHGEISVASLGNLGFAAFQSDEARAVRSQRCLRFADDDVLLLRQVSGSVAICQEACEAVAAAGDLYILDPRRPFECGIASNSHTLVCKIPRSEMERRLGNVASYTATPISPGKPVANLASTYLAMVAAHADSLEPSTRSTIANHALDLVALAFETVGRRVTELSSPRAATLLRLKSFIEANLHDPALKPATAAQAVGIGVRYASSLLAKEGSSLERYIVLRRLARCRRALMDPAHSTRTVGDIAYSYGFSDLSHFARRFKEQFGCTPREIRRK